MVIVAPFLVVLVLWVREERSAKTEIIQQIMTTNTGAMSSVWTNTALRMMLDTESFFKILCPNHKHETEFT